MKTLIIEDTPDIADVLQQSLKHMGVTCDVFALGRLGLQAIEMTEYDLLILDLNLPDIDGLTVLSKFRAANKHTPVLILSARINIEDRVKGLDLGADDYLIKPFNLSEFEARVRALLRRRNTEHTALISFSSLKYDATSREFFVHEQSLDLSPRERSVLELLIKKDGGFISKENIANSIFSFDDEAGSSAIEIYIHRLRKKLMHCDVKIITKRGLGYALA